MPVSYTEELVGEYYKHIEEDNKPKYIVQEHAYFRGKKAIRGWRDIDVLAYGEKEILIIQTKSFAIFKRTTSESIGEIVEYFKDAEAFVKSTYDVDDKEIKWIFIADTGLSDRFKYELEKKFAEANKQKEVYEIKQLREIVKEFLRALLERYPDMPNKVGREENNVTRMLMLLLYSFGKHKFLKFIEQ